MNRQERVLHHKKMNNIEKQIGIPKAREGHDGEFRVCQTGSVFSLYYRDSGKWHKVSGVPSSGPSSYRPLTDIEDTTTPLLEHLLVPSYDIGWLADASNDAAITIAHNLDTTDFPLVTLWVAQSDTGTNATLYNGDFPVFVSGSTSGSSINTVVMKNTGYIIQIVDANNIKVGTAEDGPPRFHCAALSGEDTDFTHFRMRIWI